jgi:hypothetical protein
MKKIVYLLIFSWVVACTEYNRPNDTKQVVLVNQLDTTKYIPTSKVWNIVEKKAKYDTLSFFQMSAFPFEFKPDSLFVKMNYREFKAFGLDEHYPFQELYGTNYFYGYRKYANFILFGLVVYRQHYGYGIDLITYDKNGKFVDNISVAYKTGDGGWTWEAYSRLIQDSLLHIDRFRNLIPTKETPNLWTKHQKIVKIEQNGKFTILSDKLIYKADSLTAWKIAGENFKKLNPHYQEPKNDGE